MRSGGGFSISLLEVEFNPAENRGSPIQSLHATPAKQGV
jgi:hypothetical protein